MDKLLQMYSLQKINQEQSQNLNRQITAIKIEMIIKIHSQERKALDRMGFTGEFYQTQQEEIKPLLKLFHKIQEEGNSQTHFMRPALS